jgi:N-acetylated-alpha-linked acidic dipeptidase
MSTFGDPGFHQHRAIGQYLALLTYHLASDEVLPLDVTTYSTELAAYRDDLQAFIEPYGVDLDLSELSDAIEVFTEAAAGIKKFEEAAVALDSKEQIAVVNHKYAQFQRGFISQGGLPDREFYRHAVTAPGLDTGMFTPIYLVISMCETLHD